MMAVLIDGLRWAAVIDPRVSLGEGRGSCETQVGCSARTLWGVVEEWAYDDDGAGAIKRSQALRAWAI